MKKPFQRPRHVAVVAIMEKTFLRYVTEDPRAVEMKARKTLP